MNTDKAHELTNEELEKLERRIAIEYKHAAYELTNTINDYFDKFKERDEKKKSLIGTIVNGKEYTKQDYKQWRLAQIGRGKHFEALRDKCAERVQNAREVSQSYIDDKTPGVYSLNRNYASYEIEGSVGASVSFEIWDERTVRRLIVDEPELMPTYSEIVAAKYQYDVEKWKSGITKTVTSSILQGKSIPQIAKDLRDHVGITDRASAIRAARTSITGAQNAGRIDGYNRAKELGIEIKKRWLATNDARTRHSHAALNGQIAEVNEPFESELGPIMYPGDPGAEPANLYNCRCSIVSDLGKNDNVRQVEPKETFEQWEADKKSTYREIKRYRNRKGK